MKLKNIVSAFIVLIAIFVSSSCEDMLRVDSKIVLYDDENTLDRPTDTVYSVLGIIKGMQKIADRAVILGEIRGDLVQTSDYANKDLAELYEYNFKQLKSSNRYNNPTDYYSVINNCNFFLSKADTTLYKDRKNVFIREYIAVLCYRAWTYLQLAQVYGKVYFLDKPILSGDMSQVNKGELRDIRWIADTLLYEFEKYKDRYMDEKTPSYGDLGGETGSSEQSTSHASTDFFIPVRLIMGDLALWAEHYDRAALYYHDYLTRVTDPRPTTTSKILWFSNDWLFLDPEGDTYASVLGANADPICYIPMESDIFNGVVSDLPNIFNSTKDNDYYYQLTSSKALVGLSTRQRYAFHFLNPQQTKPEPVPHYIETSSSTKYDIDVELRRGDLRLQSILSQKTRTDVDEFSTKNQSTSEQKLIKINAEKIWLYRNDVVYLRLAEALNRAGMPQMAFNILKTGLCSAVIDSASIKRAAQLNMAGVLNFDRNSFQPVEYAIESYDESTKTSSAKRTIEGKEVTKYNTRISRGNTMGIHSRGCGDANVDTTYTIGKKIAQMAKEQPESLTGDLFTDSIRAVEEFLIDEMALETCFEGHRFGDLMRIAMHRAVDNGGGYAENDFLAKRVAARRGATMENPWIEDPKDAPLHDLLKGEGTEFNVNWFLKLPEE